MVDPEDGLEGALERAYAAIASADATLAETRPQGAVWQSEPQEPEPVAKQILPVRRTIQQVPAEPQPRLSDLRSVAAITGKVMSEELGRRDSRADELEKRLATLEALVAKAKGNTQ